MTGAIDYASSSVSETKVQIPWSFPVEESGMRSKVQKQAAKAAERLSRNAERVSFAVEPVGVAERLGLQVGEPEVDRGILGALFMEPGADPRIVLNGRQSFLRCRFVCALELGHYVHMSAKTNEYERVDLVDGTEERGGESDDRYAFEFAACLLMPRLEVELFADLRMDDLEMALRFYVPREVMQRRMRALGITAPDLEAA